MLRIEVLERVPKRHPDVTKGDAVYAWKNAIACALLRSKTSKRN